MAPAASVTDVGGVTMSLLPAVPLEVRLTVRAALGAESAVITKEAGWPWGTWLSTDWIVMPGRDVGHLGPVRAEGRPGGTAPRRRTAVVCAAGGPMISPAEFWVPTL